MALLFVNNTSKNPVTHWVVRKNTGATIGFIQQYEEIDQDDEVTFRITLNIINHVELTHEELAVAHIFLERLSEEYK